MAEDTATPAGGGEQTAQAGVPADTRLIINRHYIKDLSFENPNAPGIFAQRTTPQIRVNIDVQATRYQARVFEVVLTIKVNASIEDKTAFMIELDFGSLVSLGEQVPEDQYERILGVEVPAHLFPFARNIIADVSRDGGYPPLLINPVDFDALRRQRQAGTQAEGAEAGST